MDEHEATDARDPLEERVVALVDETYRPVELGEAGRARLRARVAERAERSKGGLPVWIARGLAVTAVLAVAVVLSLQIERPAPEQSIVVLDLHEWEQAVLFDPVAAAPASDGRMLGGEWAALEELVVSPQTSSFRRGRVSERSGEARWWR